MRRRFFQLILVIGLFVCGCAGVHSQPGRREPSPRIPGPNIRSSKPRLPPKAPRAKASETANVFVHASPSDTVLLMNGQPVEGPSLVGLKPGAYVLTARRVGYNEESRSITLSPGENAPITITLDPVSGRLSVTPNVSGAAITVKKVTSDDSQSEKTFTDNVTDVSLSPAEYEISISKEGYKSIKRTVTVQPAGSVYLEPQLVKAPPEIKPAQPSAMTVQTSQAGKYLLVSLDGSSQTTSSLGMLDVVVGSTAQTLSRVSGLLPGVPCTVQLTPIDNVADYSFTERPEAGNDWKRLAVKVRPKHNNRPIHFSISWVSLPLGSFPTGKVQETVASAARTHFEPAIVRRRVLPNYPTAARMGRPGGVVVVIVEISERGKVVSAKATEGPAVLWRAAEDAAKQWEFYPAKKNGVPVRASQRLVFNFQPSGG